MRFEGATLNAVMGEIRNFYAQNGVSDLKIETVSRNAKGEYSHGDMISIDQSGTTTLRLTAADETAMVEATCDDVRGDYRAANPGMKLPHGLIRFRCEIAASDWKRTKTMKESYGE